MSKEFESTGPDYPVEIPSDASHEPADKIHGTRQTLRDTESFLDDIDALVGPRRLGGLANRHTFVMGEERSE